MSDPYRILSISDRGCEEVAIIDGESDAILIAAAPDLLAACEAALYEVDKTEIHLLLSDAIDKATVKAGET